jgi:hypothetical protein
MQEVIDRIAKLPEAEQDVYAARVLEMIEMMQDDAAVPQWHQDILRERRALRASEPDRLLTPEQFKAQLDATKAVKC